MGHQPEIMGHLRQVTSRWMRAQNVLFTLPSSSLHLPLPRHPFPLSHPPSSPPSLFLPLPLSPSLSSSLPLSPSRPLSLFLPRPPLEGHLGLVKSLCIPAGCFCVCRVIRYLRLVTSRWMRAQNVLFTLPSSALSSPLRAFGAFSSSSSSSFAGDPCHKSIHT